MARRQPRRRPGGDGAEHRTAWAENHAGTAAAFLIGLGAVALDAGDVDDAGSRYREALEIWAERRSDPNIAYCLAGLACVAAEQGDVCRAARLWGAVRALEDERGNMLGKVDRPRYLKRIERAERLDPRRFAAEVEAGRQAPLEDAVELALAPD